MSSHARAERHALADLFLEAGPDAPTLCGDWSTADLAAHLVVRERRPDAAVGILVRPLAGYTGRVQAGVRDGHPWPELVEKVRSGPPFPLSLNAIDETMNTVEYYVHLEDVRRARPGWEPRVLDAGLEAALWSRLKMMARTLMRRSPVGATLRAPGFGEVKARAGDPHVTVTGSPGELVLFAFGRQAATRVETDGESQAVSQLLRAQLGL